MAPWTFGDDGVNYHQLELDKRSSGIQVADLYIYMTGERLSETFGNLFETLMKSGDVMEAGMKMNQLKTLMAEKKMAEANDMLESMPFSVRKMKPMMLFSVQIASSL